jgi:hypothetical protein
MHENREIRCLPIADGAMGRVGKASGRTPTMNGQRKSDTPVVPVKPPNKAHAAEVVVAASATTARGR